VITRRLQAEHRTGSVRRPKTGILPTVLRNQPSRRYQSNTTQHLLASGDVSATSLLSI